MDIRSIQSAFGAYPVRPASESGKSAPSKPASRQDRVDVSAKAEELARSQGAAASARLEALPEVREEKIREVKRKLESGFYETEEFHEELASVLLKKRPF